MSATHQPATQQPDGELRAAWEDLRVLAAGLDDLGHDAAVVVRRAAAEVCDPTGFETSAVCVLRPLVGVLERVETAFADLGARLEREVGVMRDGVVAAAADLAAADAGAAGAAEDVHARLTAA